MSKPQVILKAVYRSNTAEIITTTDMRTSTLEGRNYLIAPAILLVSGVHNEEYIGYDEIVPLYADAWSGRPLVIDHPKDEDGTPVTANTPNVYENSRVGYLFNVVAREDIKGISGELWIDIEKAPTVPGGQEVLTRLQSGGSLEVSTGYFTLVDNIQGFWQNPKTGIAEKYTTSQYSIRPDHLALLPYDEGACNWADGCGAPRTNKANKQKVEDNVDHNISSEKVDMSKAVLSTAHKVARKNAAITVNGDRLGNALKASLDTRSTELGSTETLTSLAKAVEIDDATMQKVVAGELDFIPRRWLNIWAAILDVDPYELYYAASSDNSMATYYYDNGESGAVVANTGNVPVAASIPEKVVENNSVENVAAVTIVHTDVEKPCGCNKNTATNEEEKRKMADKKQRVDALIANDKTQFAEAHRDWLMGLDDTQLALLEPKVEAAPVVNTAAVVVPKVEPPVVVAPVVAAAVIEPKPMTKEQLLSTLGVDADALLAAQALVSNQKAARVQKIKDILAVEGCEFTEVELSTFSDKLLDKTFDAIQPPAYRVAAASRATNSEAIPPTPSIMTAAPGVRGVDYAVPVVNNKGAK